MNASSEPVEQTGGKKKWASMDGREKTIFVAKVCLMFASSGWIYGNTLAPDYIKPIIL